MEELDRDQQLDAQARSTHTPAGLRDPEGLSHRPRHRASRAARVGGKKVAFVSARSTYFHEADSGLFFARMNDPGFMRNGPASFRQAASKMNFGVQLVATSTLKHIAYYLTGWYPRRSPGTSPDFPVLGTGAYDWQGFNPSHPRGRLGADRQPPARRRSALPRLVEQQAGAGMGGRRRPVRLRADPPPAADRRPGPGRYRRRSQDQPGRARPVDGGARDRGPSRGGAPAHDPPGGWHPAIPRASQRDRVATELACGRRPSP